MNIYELYHQKLTGPEQIAAQAQNGWAFCSDIGLSIPYSIYEAVGNRVRHSALCGVKVHTLLDILPLACYGEDLGEGMRGISWFSGAGARKAIAGGFADLMPCCYRDIPALIADYVKVDAYCAVVSPMDEHGYFSTGCVGSISPAIIRKAKHIFLEVNRNMPRTSSSPSIHISQVTALCENHVALISLPPAEPDETSLTIGNLIAEEILDGATLQLGIGSIPDAVGMALKHKHHLGIHTEMFTESMVDLLECGAADNSRKPIHRGRTVATFALGTKRMYDFIDQNPGFEMLPVEYVNNPAVIARHPDFISVNAALEVDFYGQVCAESLGTRHVSGTGGQFDYVRGAVDSKGGKSFIAFPSTAQNGTVSKITSILMPGANVTTGKNDVDHIVTEYGIAKLRGRTLSQRTKALISIAHPKFRDELTFTAKGQNIII